MRTVKKYKFILFGTLCLIGIYFFRQWIHSIATKPDLIIYSYSSFNTPWGPGPLIKKKFEEQCKCKIEIRDVEDSRLLIQRLQLEGERAEADLLLGVHQWDVDKAVEQLGFSVVHWPEKLDWDQSSTIFSLGERGHLIPFDWGILSFNTKENSEVALAKNLNEFLVRLPPKSLVLQDPRTSAPGLSFLYWLVQVLGEEQAFQYLEDLRDKIFMIAPSWSTSYGLFQKGQAKAAFSYVTSPLYHQIEEKDLSYRALAFEEGLPTHIEFAGVLPQCIRCQKAREFLQFLLTPEIQKIVMEKNYMFPMDKKVAYQTPWDLFTKYKALPLISFKPADQQRILERWTQWSQNR